jgi:hypothetical protein
MFVQNISVIREVKSMKTRSIQRFQIGDISRSAPWMISIAATSLISTTSVTPIYSTQNDEGKDMSIRVVKSFRTFLFIGAALLISGVVHVSAQERGTTREKAVLVQENEVKDDLDGTDNTYWYKFVKGPGNVKITLEVEANETNAGATLDVFGSGTRAIVSALLAQGVDKGSERVDRTFKLTKQQTIFVRIKGIKYGDSGGTGNYTITVDNDGKKDGGDAPKPENE